jgi:hypothetical protein
MISRGCTEILNTLERLTVKDKGSEGIFQPKSDAKV